MSAVLLTVHVVLAVLTVGPVTVAASMFRPAWQAVAADASVSTMQPSGEASTLRPPGAGASEHPAGGLATVALLHRITRTYAAIGLAVPVFGLATAASLGVLTDPWVLAALVLVAAAAVVLVGRVLPDQRHLLDAVRSGDHGQVLGAAAASARLAMTTGVFNLLWVAVVVLMIWRPGSTTGV